MSFQDHLREEIQYQGLFIKELAAKTGIKKRTLDSYMDERAILPRVDTAVKLAKALGVSVEYLVEGTNSTEKEVKEFFRKYNQFEDILADLSKLPKEKIEEIKHYTRFAVTEFENSEAEKNTKPNSSD